MKVKVDSDDIATIRNALCIIQLNADLITAGLVAFCKTTKSIECSRIIEQVKRIDNLLPGKI